MFDRSDTFEDVALNILRILAGLLFMQHGAQKLFGLLTENPPVELFSLMGLAGVIEFFGGLLIVLGLLTQPVAAIAFLEMLYAYFTVHLPRGFWPIQNGGELALLYAIIFLYLAARGTGSFSLDDAFGLYEEPEDEAVEPVGREPV